MTFLPIVDRELRVAARRKSTHRIRLWTTFGGALVNVIFLLFMRVFGSVFGGPGNWGGILFGLLAWYTFGMCLLAGVFLAADVLSEEKREGTLGLLFLTDLKGYDVVLGKFVGIGLAAWPALPQVHAALQDPEPMTRRAAILALLAIDDPRETERALLPMTHKDPTIPSVFLCFEDLAQLVTASNTYR